MVSCSYTYGVTALMLVVLTLTMFVIGVARIRFFSRWRRIFSRSDVAERKPNRGNNEPINFNSINYSTLLLTLTMLPTSVLVLVIVYCVADSIDIEPPFDDEEGSVDVDGIGFPLLIATIEIVMLICFAIAICATCCWKKVTTTYSTRNTGNKDVENI
ncbi:hypothetical protein Ocin01_06907 [Orchesella cincta]|uniref:Uncharacterized protein n=1 Tax=Orchesella cincta TaxID=48709 RepID=A0A1D2N3A7_ORCCI|nr:hypothetical protein Ocin01_06907 [Orchesella cincta]